jgi:hypothetical protein
MADFQFYRPQVNALERLWAQYAEAEGSKGGAFMRGLAPGLEALGKGIREERAAKAEREFEATQLKTKTDAERKLALELARIEAMGRSRDARLEANSRLAAANAEAQGKLDVAQAEADAKQSATKAILKSGGLNVPEEQLDQLAGQLGDPQNATRYLDQQRQANQEAVAKAEREAAERSLGIRTAQLGAGIDRISASSFAKQMSPTILQLRQQLNDPKQLDQVGSRIEQLEGRMALLDWAKATVDSYDKLKPDQVAAYGNQDALRTSMQELRGAVSALSDSNTMQYFLSNDDAFDREVQNIIGARNRLNNSLVGVGAEAKFWQTEAEKGRGALRPQAPGQPVRLSGGELVDLTPQMQAQLNEAAAERVRKSPEFSVIMSRPEMTTFPIGGDAAQMKMYLEQKMSTSKAKEMLDMLQPMIQKARVEELQSRGFTVLRNAQDDPDLFSVNEATGEIRPTPQGGKMISGMWRASGKDPFKMQQMLRDRGMFIPSFDQKVEEKRQKLQTVSETDYAAKAKANQGAVERRMAERSARIDKELAASNAPADQASTKKVIRSTSPLSERDQSLMNALTRTLTRRPL